MNIYKTSDDKFVAATYRQTTKRFRTTLTKSKLPVEASDVNDLEGVTKYCSIESVKRALRKRKK
jgi:hypothetical protein